MKEVYTNLMKVYTRKGDSGETGLYPNEAERRDCGSAGNAQSAEG